MIVGAHGAIFTTNNGACSWDKTFSQDHQLISFCFINDDIGYLLGGNCSIYKTSDGGENWSEIYNRERRADSTGYSIYWEDPTEMKRGKKLNFLNEEIGWVTGSFQTEGGDSMGAGILGTVDGGKNWDLVWTYQADSRFSLTSIHTMGTEAWTVGGRGLIVR